ncbi:MAG: hypothetical protein ACOX4M_09475 [Acetivibrionales bacterium]|jgi:hypothetical protein
MKRWVRYIVVSAMIVAAFILIGYVSYLITGWAFPSIYLGTGGEVGHYAGIGFFVDRHSPFTTVYEMGLGTEGRFYVVAVSVIFFILLFTGIQWLIAVIKNKRKKAKTTTTT